MSSIKERNCKKTKVCNKNIAWEKVNIARNPSRATSLDYIEYIFDDFIELHGDRNFKDDKSIVCGLATINNIPFTIIAEQKGRNTKENIERNFGMPNPESYRKALRFMKQAEKFKRPIITFVDTKGAYPGIGAEERGQGEAIARNIMEMFTLKVPIIVFIIGEGSSGGALAIAVGDKVYMLENSVYSILSPEGYASILWKDSSRVQEAAEKMKMTAQDLFDMGIIDKIIEEPVDLENVSSENINNGKVFDIKKISEQMRSEILNNIKILEKKETNVLLKERYDKFRKMGTPHRDGEIGLL